MSGRLYVKELIRRLEQENEFLAMNIFRSVENVNLNTVICYKKDGEKHHFLDGYDERAPLFAGKPVMGDDAGGQ